MPIKADIRGERVVLDFISRLPSRISKQVTSELAKDSFRTMARATESRHTDTGAMRRSLFNRRSGKDNRQVGFDPNIAPHAVFVLRGTKAHKIRPRKAKLLIFYWERLQSTVFFKEVNHPGYRGDDLVLESVERIRRIMKSVVRDSTRGLK